MANFINISNITMDNYLIPIILLASCFMIAVVVNEGAHMRMLRVGLSIMASMIGIYAYGTRPLTEMIYMIPFVCFFVCFVFVCVDIYHFAKDIKNNRKNPSNEQKE